MRDNGRYSWNIKAVFMKQCVANLSWNLADTTNPRPLPRPELDKVPLRHSEQIPTS